MHTTHNANATSLRPHLNNNSKYNSNNHNITHCNNRSKFTTTTTTNARYHDRKQYPSRTQKEKTTKATVTADTLSFTSNSSVVVGAFHFFLHLQIHKHKQIVGFLTTSTKPFARKRSPLILPAANDC